MPGRSASTFYNNSRPGGARDARGDGPPEPVIDMLSRYPNVSGAEAAQITAYLKQARYLDIDRIKSDDKVRWQLDLFLSRNRHALRPSATELISFAALVIAFLAICWLLWTSIGSGGAS